MSSPDMSIVLTALPIVAPTARTGCSEWTAHEVRAHLAAGAHERAELVENELNGGVLTGQTQDRGERELPFLALTDGELRTAVMRESKRFSDAALALTARDTTTTVRFGSTRFTPAQLLAHQQSEAAIHCWDLIGYDGVNNEVLARPSLTRHAVTALNSLPELAEAPRSRAQQMGVPELRMALRSPGRPHVIFDASAGLVELSDEPPEDVDAVITADPATRLLLLWGRCPGVQNFTVEVRTAAGRVVEECCSLP